MWNIPASIVEWGSSRLDAKLSQARRSAKSEEKENINLFTMWMCEQFWIKSMHAFRLFFFCSTFCVCTSIVACKRRRDEIRTHFVTKCFKHNILYFPSFFLRKSVRLFFVFKFVWIMPCVCCRTDMQAYEQAIKPSEYKWLLKTNNNGMWRRKSLLCPASKTKAKRKTLSYHLAIDLIKEE